MLSTACNIFIGNFGKVIVLYCFHGEVTTHQIFITYKISLHTFVILRVAGNIRRMRSYNTIFKVSRSQFLYRQFHRVPDKRYAIFSFLDSLWMNFFPTINIFALPIFKHTSPILKYLIFTKSLFRQYLLIWLWNYEFFAFEKITR